MKRFNKIPVLKPLYQPYFKLRWLYARMYCQAHYDLHNFTMNSNYSETIELKLNFELNPVELIRFCYGEPYPNYNFWLFFDYFCVFFVNKFYRFGSNRIDQLNTIQYLHQSSRIIFSNLKFGSIEPNFFTTKT